MVAPTGDGDGFYVVDRRSYIPTILTQGPWDPGAQHGGPVAGLLATVVEATPSLVPMQIVRLTVDLLRPVPLDALDTERRVIREGKRIQAVEVLLLSGTDLVARCSALRIRLGADVSSGAPVAPVPATPGPETAAPAELGGGYRPGVLRAVDIRVVPPGGQGGGITWMQVTVPLLAGHPTSPIPQLAVVADFASLSGTRGVGRRFVAINGDVNLHVLRPPSGSWIALRGRTAFSTAGIGQSVADLADLDGHVGVVSCAQVVDERPVA